MNLLVLNDGLKTAHLVMGVTVTHVTKTPVTKVGEIFESYYKLIEHICKNGQKAGKSVRKAV
jgi:hypothetical protein